ncbi:32897_t:CDS:2, partial [Gigaspora margarita]
VLAILAKNVFYVSKSLLYILVAAIKKQNQRQAINQMEKLLDSNFNQTFSVCFCSACHSKYERIKKVKSNTTDIEKLNTTNTKQSESSLYNNSSKCDSELKFKLFVKNENRNILPGKSITTKLVNFEEFKDLIQQWICKINNNYSIVISNYSLSYKVEHSQTGTMILQDNDIWKEFLKQYKPIKIITDKIICIKKNTTIDTPPVYPIFNISYGQIVRLQFPSQSTNSNNTLPYGMSYTPQPQIIYYPAHYSSKRVHKFFLKLEVINNESESYILFERAFENEKILLDTIKELSESDLIELGVNKMR